MTNADSVLYFILKSREEEKLDSLGTEILKQLHDKRFIVNSSVDEIKELQRLLNSTNNRGDYYILTINPTLSCNFRCWYCYENHSNKPLMSHNDILSITNLIERILRNPSINHLAINFFGGEPLLGFSKVIKPITESALQTSKKYKKKYSISLTTNGYLLSHEQALFFQKHNISNYQITIDGNRERHNEIRTDKKKSETYDKIIKNVKYILSIGCNVILRLNISDQTNMDVPLLLKDFSDISPKEKRNLCFSVQKVWQASDAVFETVRNIVNEIRTYGYKCQPFELSYYNIHNTCYSDKTNHLIINPHGEIFGCTAREFNKENIEGKLHQDGSIIYNEKRKTRIQMSPLENVECRQCFILPMCIGGCKQRLLENKKFDRCPHGFSESDKQRFAEQYILEKLNNIQL